MESAQAEVTDNRQPCIVASSDDEDEWPLEDDAMLHHDANQSLLHFEEKSDISHMSESSDIDDDSVIKVHEKRTVVNSSTPLWKCVNATKSTKKCVYCFCHGCYNAESEKENKKRKRQRQTKLDKNTSGRCNHKFDNLVMDADSSYYTDLYLSKMIEMEQHYPTMCSNCGYKLTNKAQ
jgi:hypothetical protein